MNFFADEHEGAHFRIRVNDQPICQASCDMTNSAADNGTPSCAAVATLTEGTENIPALHITHYSCGLIMIIMKKFQ